MEIDPRQTFIDFALQVIDHLSLPHPDVPPDGGGALEFGLNIDGLATTMTYEPEIHPGHVLLECRIGGMPAEADAATSLLASNAHTVVHGGPTWGFDRQTREVTCNAMLPAGDTQVSALAHNIKDMAAWARLWPDREIAASAEFLRGWKLAVASEPAREDWRATFADALSRIRACDGIELLSEAALSTGGRRAWASLDGAPLALTHKFATDEFFTACLTGDLLDGALASRLTERLLEANRLSLQGAGLAFGLDAKHRRLLCRLTVTMPCRDIDGLLDGMRVAFDGISNCDSQDDEQGSMLSLPMCSLVFLHP